MQRHILLLLAVLALLPLPASAQTLDEIVSRMLTQDENENENLKAYFYQQTIITEKLNDKEEVKETGKLETIIRPGDDQSFTIVAGEKGGAMMPTPEKEKLEKQVKESESFKANFTMRKLAPRFDLTLKDREMLDGEETFVIAFHPKPNQPYNDRIEKILNQLQGQVWIRAADYSILQTKATLSQPIDIAWFFATLEKLDFYYHSQVIPGGRGPEHFDFSFRVALPISEIRQRQFISMRDFQLKKADKTSATP